MNLHSWWPMGELPMRCCRSDAKEPRVNKDESDQMVEALKKRGVVVEYMVKDNEGHGFANEENRFDFYEAMEKFLAKHIKS